MTISEQELIKKLQNLKSIQPRKEWVLSSKARILANEPKMDLFQLFRLFFSFKPALITTFVGIIVVLVFSFAQKSLPGDAFYSIKKISEKGQAALIAPFVSNDFQPNYQLQLANNRLNELATITAENKTGNLAAGIKEFKTTKIAAKKEVLNSVKNVSTKDAVKIAKQVAPILKEMNQKEKQVFASLGIETPKEKEINGFTEKAIVEILIKDLENSVLTERQTEMLNQAKVDYQQENYQQALEKLLW